MKKLLGVAIALALCLAVAPGAFAIDDASLEKMTTEGLYDRNDAFDHALEPGLLYHLDRWRLYTNLSGYDSNSPSGDRPCCFDDRDWDNCNWDNEGSYLIGTSGPLFNGNMAFFYETNRYKFDGLEFDRDFEASDEGDFSSEPRYDGVNDWEYTYISTDGSPSTEFFREGACPTCTDNYVPYAEGEIEENNFYFAYGMDFDGFSLGLSYAPELREEEVSMRVHRGQRQNPFTGSYNFYPSMSGYTFFDRIDERVDRYSARIEDPKSEYEQWWGRVGDLASDYRYETWQHNNSGKLDRDITVHPVHVQSHIRLWSDWDILTGIGYANIEQEDKFHAVRAENASSYDTEYGLRGWMSGKVTADGSVCEDRDGDEWSIFVSPQRVINDMVTVRMDLYYANEDGDFEGGQRYTTVYDAIDLGDTPGESPVETLHFEQVENDSIDGDYEIDKWAIEPRVYLTFDRVRFALGAGYRYEDEEIDGIEREDVSAYFTYDDSTSFDASLGQGLNGPDDRIFWGSWKGYERFGTDIETETWRFPVATEFDVTDKLTFRAGAAYYRRTIEYERTGHQVNRYDEYYAVTDGEGNSSWDDCGPEDQVLVAGQAEIPYDADTHEETNKDSFELTTDWTTYNLGLGYQFTENLQLDLMWSGKGASGGVDMTDVFASITLAF